MKLRTLITLIAAAALLVSLFGVGLVIQTSIREYTAATAVRAVEVRAETLSTILTRALEDEWRRIRLAAQRFTPPQDGNLTPFIEGLTGDASKDAWIGVAATDGTVLAATGDMLVGEDVSQRPWFQEGLRAPFAGDVHEAVLLARLLASNRAEPLRFVDFSAPLSRADGSLFGVVGAHVNWRWVRALVDDVADTLRLDVFIVNRAGTVILATAQTHESLPSLGSFQAAQLGRTVTGVETWPDDREYFVATVPNMTAGAMPPLGWSLVARLDPAFVTRAETRFLSRTAIGATAAFALALAGFAIMAAMLLRPLLPLSQSVLAIARGEDGGFAREYRRFKEATILSDAVALLQSGETEQRPRR